MQQEAARGRASDQHGHVKAHDSKRDCTARAALNELRGQCHVERSEFKTQPDGEQRAEAQVDRKSGAHDHAVNATVQCRRRGHADGQSALFLLFEPARNSLERHHERGAHGKSDQRRRRLIVGAKVRKQLHRDHCGDEPGGGVLHVGPQRSLDPHEHGEQSAEDAQRGSNRKGRDEVCQRIRHAVIVLYRSAPKHWVASRSGA